MAMKFGRKSRTRGRNTDPTGVPYGSVGSVYNKPGSTNVVPTPVTTGTAYSKNQNLATGNVTEEGIVNDPFKNRNVINQEQSKNVIDSSQTINKQVNTNPVNTNVVNQGDDFLKTDNFQANTTGISSEVWLDNISAQEWMAVKNQLMASGRTYAQIYPLLLEHFQGMRGLKTPDYTPTRPSHVSPEATGEWQLMNQGGRMKWNYNWNPQGRTSPDPNTSAPLAYTSEQVQAKVAAWEQQNPLPSFNAMMYNRAPQNWWSQEAINWARSRSARNMTQMEYLSLQRAWEVEKQRLYQQWTNAPASSLGNSNRAPM